MLHSNEFSRIDDFDKIPIIVDIGQCPVTKAQIYDLNPQRQLFYDDQGIFSKLTGRNPSDKFNPNAPHPVWTEIQKKTATETKPKGIVGSEKIDQIMQMSLQEKMTPSLCSCGICEELQDGLQCFNGLRKLWHYVLGTGEEKGELVKAKISENASSEEMSQFLQLFERNN